MDIINSQAAGPKDRLGVWPPLVYLSSGTGAAMLEDAAAVDEAAKQAGDLFGVHWFGGANALRVANQAGTVPAGLRRFTAGR